MESVRARAGFDTRCRHADRRSDDAAVRIAEVRVLRNDGLRYESPAERVPTSLTDEWVAAARGAIGFGGLVAVCERDHRHASGHDHSPSSQRSRQGSSLQKQILPVF